MKNLDIKEVEAKGEFVKDFNLWIALYENKLGKLGLSNEENLALILRDKVYEIEEDFSFYQANSFFSSIVGKVIVELFKDLLYLISDKMDKAYEKKNNSALYCFVHMFLAEKWYVEYKQQCLSYKNILSVKDYCDSIVMKFYEYMNENDFTDEQVEDLFITFKTELIVLCDGDDTILEIDSGYVKTIGARD